MSAAATGSPDLVRRLGTGDAVVIGLGSMLGAGVFAVWGPAARAAGTALLLGLGVAAVVAYCNAVASAQLAAVYPVSGGTYVYAGRRLGPWWGFCAGWAFVVGKTASCAAMALTFASYAVSGPAWLQRAAAVAVVAAVACLNYRGVTKTVLATRVLVTCTLLVLVTFVVGTVTSRATSSDHLDGWWSPEAAGVHGVLQAAGLLFFAFAGYARIATMGEEVRNPRSTIPRAIPLALLLTVGVYVVVGVAALLVSGAAGLATSTSPLSTVAETAGRAGVVPLVRLGAAVASLGALLALMAGIGRTSLAMARGGDLPSWLGAVHPRFRVPHHAEVLLAAAVGGLVLVTDLRAALGFSSFGVLVYYALANASAFSQPRSDRRWPRALNVLGVVGCLTLAVSLPGRSVAVGLVALAAGLAGRAVVVRRRRSSGSAEA